MAQPACTFPRCQRPATVTCASCAPSHRHFCRECVVDAHPEGEAALWGIPNRPAPHEWTALIADVRLTTVDKRVLHNCVCLSDAVYLTNAAMREFLDSPAHQSFHSLQELQPSRDDEVHKDENRLAVAWDHTNREMYVAVRGTTVQVADILADLMCILVPMGEGNPGSVHCGFLQRARKVPMKTIENWLEHPDHRHYKLYMTGHSLGGAVAQLATIRYLMQAGPPCMLDRIQCVTFGAPYIGDARLAQWLQQSSFASKLAVFVHGRDVVAGMLNLVHSIENAHSTLVNYTPLLRDLSAWLSAAPGANASWQAVLDKVSKRIPAALTFGACGTYQFVQLPDPSQANVDRNNVDLNGWRGNPGEIYDKLAEHVPSIADHCMGAYRLALRLIFPWENNTPQAVKEVQHLSMRVLGMPTAENDSMCVRVSCNDVIITAGAADHALRLSRGDLSTRVSISPAHVPLTLSTAFGDHKIHQYMPSPLHFALAFQEDFRLALRRAFAVSCMKIMLSGGRMRRGFHVPPGTQVLQRCKELRLLEQLCRTLPGQRSLTQWFRNAIVVPRRHDVTAISGFLANSDASCILAELDEKLSTLQVRYRPTVTSACATLCGVLATTATGTLAVVAGAPMMGGLAAAVGAATAAGVFRLWQPTLQVVARSYPTTMVRLLNATGFRPDAISVGDESQLENLVLERLSELGVTDFDEGTLRKQQVFKRPVDLQPYRSFAHLDTQSLAVISSHLLAIRSMHELRRLLTASVVLVVIGTQNAGKSSLLNDVFRCNAPAGNTPADHTTSISRLYELTSSFSVLDCPGVNDPQARDGEQEGVAVARAFTRILGQLCSVAIVVVHARNYDADAAREAIALARETRANVIVCLNHADALLEHASEFGARLMVAAERLAVPLDRIRFTCLLPHAPVEGRPNQPYLQPNQLAQLRAAGVLDSYALTTWVRSVLNDSDLLSSSMTNGEEEVPGPALPFE